LRGLGITFILTGLMAIAFMSFMGLKSIIKLKMIILGINSTTIISSVIVFSLQFATCLYNSVCQIKAYSSGLVKIIINEEDVLETEAGSTLLPRSIRKYFYPQPAVAVVLADKCQILSGGGEILPTDLIFQEKNSKTTGIGMPSKGKTGYENSNSASVMGIKNGSSSNDNVATYIKELVVKLVIFLDFESGSYIQIDIPSAVDFKNDLYKMTVSKKIMTNLEFGI
jgi:Na+-transporting NADH:ubiquinone oxidoreductase subunit F